MTEDQFWTLVRLIEVMVAHTALPERSPDHCTEEEVYRVREIAHQTLVTES